MDGEVGKDGEGGGREEEQGALQREQVLNCTKCSLIQGREQYTSKKQGYGSRFGCFDENYMLRRVKRVTCKS